MPPANPFVARSTFLQISRTIYSWLVMFPVACFTLALATDIFYWQTLNLMWAEFSAWLLLAGIVIGALAIPFGAIAFFGNPYRRRNGLAWAHVFACVLVLVIAFFNNLVHAADGWPAVMPWGLTLSALTVLVMIIAALLGELLVRRAGDYRYA